VFGADHPQTLSQMDAVAGYTAAASGIIFDFERRRRGDSNWILLGHLNLRSPIF